MSKTAPIHNLNLVRTTRRGEINLFNNTYFSILLEEFNGRKVQIAYDTNKPETVLVYTQEGRFICTAEANGNSYAEWPDLDQNYQNTAQFRAMRKKKAAA